MLTSVKIVLTSVILGVIYGIIHDLITANLCVEYFTIGHPRVIESVSPYALALVWGVIATWWAGLFMGIFLAIAGRAGSRPKAEYSMVVRYMVQLLIIMFLLALIGGVTGYVLSVSGAIHLLPPYADMMDMAAQHRFLAAGWAHGTSYFSAFIGTIVICILIYRKRRLMGKVQE